MTRYETLAYDPGIPFAWTLRSEEIARRQRQRPRDIQADRKKFECKRRDEAQVLEQAAGYETPAFAPSVGFSWTLRSAEIAHRQSGQPFSLKANLSQLTVLAAA